MWFLQARCGPSFNHYKSLSIPYEEGLQRQRLRVDLVTAFKIFTGLLGVGPNLFFPSPTAVARTLEYLIGVATNAATNRGEKNNKF